MTSSLLYVIIQHMTLSDELKAISGRKRRFLLLRIIDVGTEAARQLCGVTEGTYNTWLHNASFSEIYRRRGELAAEFKQEALRLMRRDNQLQAVLLEEKIIKTMKDEIDSGEYNFIRTNLAREVYSKLINDLDYQPQVQNLTWQQRVQQLIVNPEQLPQIEEGEITDGEVISETVSEQATEHPQGIPITEN